MWTDAQSYCRSAGGDLASITSGIEQAFMTMSVGPKGINANTYIGKLKYVANKTNCDA